MYSLTLQLSASLDGQAVGGTRTVQADGELKRDIALTGVSTNVLIAATVPLAGLKAVVISATAPCTLKTNSSSAPADTFNLVANSPIIWTAGVGGAPFSADISALYASAPADCNLTIWFLVDATP